MAAYKFENINVSFGTDIIYKNFSIEFEKKQDNNNTRPFRMRENHTFKLHNERYSEI